MLKENKTLTVFIGLAFISSIGLAKIPSAAGIELGGNGTLLITDPSVGAFGAGAGLQGSLIYKMWTDRPIAAKLRIESLSLKEEAVQKSGSDYLLSGSSLKSLAQPWTVISLGGEGQFKTQGQVCFWEAMVGYALGKSATVTVTQGQPDLTPVDISMTTRSGFAVSGGVGVKREFSKIVTGLMSVRSMFLIGPTYSSAPLSSKTFIPFPILFNLGAEFPFDL